MEYRKDYFIHYYNSDTHLNASITNILRMMEDIAVQQSEDRGVGIDHYKKNKVAWMLTRWKIDFIELPKFRDTITIITKPRAFRGFYANREYDVINSSGKSIIKANTLWVFVNTESKRPTKVPDYMYSSYGLTENDMKQFTKLDEVNSVEKIDHEKTFEVLFKDIDTNQHVNNSQYIEWAVETIPTRILKSYRIKNMKVNYLKEVYHGDSIISRLQIAKGNNTINCLHSINSGEGEVCRLESDWIPFK